MPWVESSPQGRLFGDVADDRSTAYGAASFPGSDIARALDGLRGASTKREEAQHVIAMPAGRSRGRQAAGEGDGGSADTGVTPG